MQKNVRSSEAELDLPSIEKKETNVTVFTLGPAPDGGFTAWAQVAAGFFCSFNSWGVINSFGVFQEYYGKTILPGETPSRISWIGALVGMLSYFGASVFGFLIDKGYARILCVAATVIASFSWMMLSLSTQYYQFILTQGVLAGVCSSILFSCGISAVAPYFTTKRGIALGITTTGSSVGGIIYSIATQRLLISVGFAWTCRIIGFILLATGVTTGCLLKPRINHAKVQARTAEGGIRAYFAYECFTEPAYMLFSLAILFSFLALYIFYDYYQAHAFTIGNDSSYKYLTAVINAGSLVGRLLPSYIADRIGMFSVVIPGCLISALLSFCWIAVDNKPGVFALAVLFGIFSGPIAVAQGVIAAKLTKNMDRLGVRIGFSFLLFGLGLLLGAPFAGIIVHKHGYLGAQLYASIAWVVAAILFFASRWVALKQERLPFWVKF